MMDLTSWTGRMISTSNSSSSDVFVYPSLSGMTPEQMERNKAAVIAACMNATFFFEPGVLYCNQTLDRVCWPPTKAGEVAEVQCFEHRYTDTSLTVKRECFENGTWQLQTSYVSCLKKTIDDGYVKDEVQIIYQVGFSITTLALIVAIAIFLHFKCLRCLRNLIHCNLMFSMLISNTLFLIMTRLLPLLKKSFIGCKTAVVITTYFNSTVYFWMFVEGIYLFIIIMWAFAAHRIRLWHFFILGWGFPIIIVIIWASLLATYEPPEDLCWLPIDESDDFHSIIRYSCLTALVVNVALVFTVIWILVRKVRMTSAIETNQIKKAVKALCVLLPLLGLHFVFTDILERFVNLFSADGAYAFRIVRHFIQAFQGFLVALLYCFLNSEVQTVLRQRLNAVKENRSIQRYTSSILLTKSRASIPEVSSSSYNVGSKNRKPKMSLSSKCSADDNATTMSMMDSCV